MNSHPIVIGEAGQYGLPTLLKLEQSALGQAIADKSVAIQGFSQEETVVLSILSLIAARTLFLLPSEITPDDLTQLVEDQAIHAVLTPSGDFGLSDELDSLRRELSESFARQASTIEQHSEGAELPPVANMASVILTTSGTTGKPKLVKHNLEFLSSTVKRGRKTDRPRHWGLVYDVGRFAGFQVFLQSLLSGATLLVTETTWPMDQKLQFLIRNNVSHLSATPSFWRRWLMSPLAKDAQLERITLGGEIADQSVLDALTHRYPNAKLVHIYASTESGVGFTVTDGREGFSATLLLESGDSDLSIRVLDGRLYIKRENCVTGYLDSGTRFVDADGFVDTGDRVELRGDRYVFLGRENGSINIGGVKVFPEVTERRLLEHSKVRECIVYSAPNAVMGNTLRADIVLTDAANASDSTKFELMRWCKEKLQPEFVPTKVSFSDSLAISASGKLARKTS